MNNDAFFSHPTHIFKHHSQLTKTPIRDTHTHLCVVAILGWTYQIVPWYHVFSAFSPSAHQIKLSTKDEERARAVINFRQISVPLLGAWGSCEREDWSVSRAAECASRTWRWSGDGTHPAMAYGGVQEAMATGLQWTEPQTSLNKTRISLTASYFWCQVGLNRQGTTP